MEENKDIENIDELSRSVIESHEINPPDRAWDSLDAELTKKQAVLYKKRADRFRLLSITLALLLLFFVAFHYFSLRPTANESGKITEKSLPENYQNANDLSAQDHSAVSSSDVSHTTEKNISPWQNAAPGNTSGVLNPEEKKNVSTSIDDNGSAARNKKETHLISSQVHKTREMENTNLTSSSEKEITLTNESRNDAAEVSLETNKHSDESIVKDVRNELAMPANNSEKKNFNETESTEVKSNLSYDSQKSIGDTTKPEESTLQKHDLSVSNSSHDSLLSTRTRIVSRLSVAAFYSPVYARNHLVDKISGDDEDVSEYYQREQSEYSYSAGANLRYDLNHHWSLAAGCSFSATSYSMTYSVIYIKYGWDNQLHIQYPTSSGIIEVPNTGNNTWQEGDSLSVVVNCDQLLKFINVPLTARYEFKKNRFSFYGDAGLSANFIVQEIVKLSFGTVNKTIFNNVDGLRKMNYGFLFGAGSQFNFKNGIGIFVEPVISGSITSITHKTSMDSYPYSFGLNTGVSLHF